MTSSTERGEERGELERRIVTVLFCDLAGFTSLSEQLDAEDVATVQQAYFAAVRDAVARHGGTLEKFIGDAAVAVYGVPVAGEDDAERAVRTGLAIVAAVEQVAASLGLDGHSLHVRVGVNTGEAVVHPAPAPGDAMVTGDVVNTAARLQAAAKLGTVLVGPDTALAVARSVELEDAGRLELKGKAQTVAASRAVAALTEPERERAMQDLRAPTVGRHRELALLADALASCVRGEPGRITIVAPPGTGKSRLLQEFAAHASREGVSVRSARVRPDVLAAFRPAADLVLAALGEVDVAVDLAGLRGQLEPALGAIRAAVVADELAALLAGFGERGEELEADARRDARFAAWSDGLAALARGPEVWLVEDVHWSAPDFRAFLASATRAGRLVACTSRPSLLEEDGEWTGAADVLPLEPLTDTSAAELVRALVGDAVPSEFVARIAERSSGNPLFVEELLRTWVATGLLVRANGRWFLARAVDEVALPSTVQAIYAAQLDDLPAGCRRLVRRASVAGRQFPVAVLEQLDAADEPSLDALARRGVVRGPVADAVLGDSFAFRHALLRDVGYASLSRAERARLHGRMARWLEWIARDRPQDLADVIGRHYAVALASVPALAPELGDGLTRGEARARAGRWFELAGDVALSAAAFQSAGALFSRALEHTPSDAVRDHARRLLGLARAIAFTSDMAAGLEAAEEALTLYRALAQDDGGSLQSREDVSRAAFLVGTIYVQQLRFAGAMALASDVLAELGDRDDAATIRLLLLRARGAEMIGEAEWREAAPDRRRVAEVVGSLGDVELELQARMCTAWEESDQRAAWLEIERLAHELRRWPDVAEARRVLTALCLPDDVEGVRASAATLASFAAGHELWEPEAWASYYLCEAGLASGSWDDALAAGRHALEAAEAGSYHRAAARTWFALVPIAAARRERAVLERAAAWYARMDSFPDSPYGRFSRTAVDILLADNGLPSTFRVPLVELEPSVAEVVHLPSWFEALDVVVADALAHDALDDVRQAVRTYRVAHEREPTASGWATLALLEARLAAADGSSPEDVRGHVALLREHGRPWPLLKGLGLLVTRESATPDELEEARGLRARLALGH
jgi:class 3 adenylate cyclase/tetratricopeptide (TPR) repeat protein